LNSKIESEGSQPNEEEMKKLQKDMDDMKEERENRVMNTEV
jgi:hypothetical protein